MGEVGGNRIKIWVVRLNPYIPVILGGSIDCLNVVVKSGEFLGLSLEVIVINRLKYPLIVTCKHVICWTRIVKLKKQTFIIIAALIFLWGYTILWLLKHMLFG